MRYEFSCKTPQDTQKAIELIKKNNIKKINYANKTKDEFQLPVLQKIMKECPGVEVCTHFSIKFQYTGNAKTTYLKFISYCQTYLDNGIKDILLCSGNPKRALTTVKVISQSPKLDPKTNLHVAFNPYIKDLLEYESLKSKLISENVKSVYFQFGTDIEETKKGVEFIRSLRNDVKIYGSILVPTKSFIQKLKFRPWKGLVIDPKYFESLESATSVCRNLAINYKKLGLIPLAELTEISQSNIDLFEQITN